jgi:hypothetical protein
MQDIEETLSHNMDKLCALLPQECCQDRVAEVFAQWPAYIFRMDHYRDARTMADLPYDLRTRLLDDVSGPYGPGSCEI